MADDKFDLTWSDFSSNVANNVRNLLNDSYFTDVTLVSDDRKLIKAHKVILSSCSQFFHQILAEISTKDPVLFLKGIQYSELVPIVRFIYLGTTQIDQDNLGKFIRAAEDLQIEGLQRIMNTKEDDIISKNQNANSYDFPKQELVINEESYYEDDEQKVDTSIYQEKYQVDLQNIYNSKGNDGLYSCGMCEYKTKKSSGLKTHIQSKHLGVRVNCGRCTAEFYDKSTLQRHFLSKHGKMQVKQAGVHSSSLINHRTK